MSVYEDHMCDLLSRCSLTTEEVRESYRLGGPEAHESTDILFLSRAVSFISELDFLHIQDGLKPNFIIRST